MYQVVSSNCKAHGNCFILFTKALTMAFLICPISTSRIKPCIVSTEIHQQRPILDPSWPSAATDYKPGQAGISFAYPTARNTEASWTFKEYFEVLPTVGSNRWKQHQVQYSSHFHNNNKISKHFLSLSRHRRIMRVLIYFEGFISAQKLFWPSEIAEMTADIVSNEEPRKHMWTSKMQNIVWLGRALSRIRGNVDQEQIASNSLKEQIDTITAGWKNTICPGQQKICMDMAVHKQCGIIELIIQTMWYSICRIR